MKSNTLIVAAALLTCAFGSVLVTPTAALVGLHPGGAGSALNGERDALVGQWESQDSKFTIVYLTDGRTASVSKGPASAAAVRLETGEYRVEGDRIKYQWMLTEPQEEQFRVDGDSLTAGRPNSPFRSRLRRTGGPDKAAATYEEIDGAFRRTAEISFKEVVVGPVKPGQIRPTEIIPDTRFAEVFPNATAYGQKTQFQWVLSPPHRYETHSPNEPGVTCCSYTFLPNGRFYFDGWWYGVLVDDSLPFDSRSPAEVRGREVPMRHTQFWGKYRVTPGKDALEGDIVEVVRDNGSRRTMRAADGRRYLIISNPRMLFNNWEEVNRHRQ